MSKKNDKSAPHGAGYTPPSEAGDIEKRPPCFTANTERHESYINFIKKRIDRALKERDSPTLIFIQDLLMLEGMEMLDWKPDQIFKEFEARDEIVQNLDKQLQGLGIVNKGGGIVFDSGDPVGEK